MTENHAAVAQDVLIELYRSVYKTRRFEQQCIELYRGGMVWGYLHPYLGEEGFAAGACAAIGKQVLSRAPLRTRTLYC